MRSPLLCFAALSCMLAASAPAVAATLSVGPGKPFAKPCDAIAKANAGDIVEVDAAGSYDGDTCSWTTDNLTIRGINGRAKIDAKALSMSAGGIPGGKGIFTIYAPNATVESFELSGASVPSANGAGIRHQGLNLTVRDCFFHDNEDGILGGPLANGQPADGQGTVLVERSEFAHNGAGDGQSHNMYLNHYAKFTLQYSYSHGANAGHLVKSRALESHVLYNRLSDDESMNVSYEVNLPEGGKGYVIGNLIEQNADPNGTENGAIIDFASELVQPVSELFVVNNTVVNNRMQGGTFVQILKAIPTNAVLRNNVFDGKGTICSQMTAVLDHNFTMGDPKLVDPANVDFHLQPGSPCVDMGIDPGMGDGQPLAPTFQYVHPASFETRTTVGTIDIGAYELGGGGTGGGGTGGGSPASSGSGGPASSGSGGPASSGSGSGSGSAGAGGHGASTSGGTGGGSSTGTPGMKGGCGCGVAGDTAGAPVALLAALAWMARRRRRHG